MTWTFWKDAPEQRMIQGVTVLSCGTDKFCQKSGTWYSALTDKIECIDYTLKNTTIKDLTQAMNATR